MPAEGDILRITQYFRQGAREAAMVSFWTLVDNFGAFVSFDQYAEAVHTFFGSAIVPYFMHTTGVYYRTVIDDMTDGLSFGDFSEDIAGSVVGDPMPPFVAVSIKQNVGSRLTRAGFKRIPYISENSSNGTTPVIPATGITNAELWFGDGAVLDNPVGGADFLQIAPVVVGRVLVATPTPHYELDLDVINPVTTAIVQRITSQNSRKT